MSTPDVPAGGPHADDQHLAALAMGDVAEVDEVTRAHVDACDFCTSEVAALRETLSLVLAAGAETFTAPPASVWAAVSAELGSELDAGSDDDEDDIEPGAGVVHSLSERRRVPAWLAATAAAVALAAGVGIGTQVVGGSDPDETAPAIQVLGATDLASLDNSPQARGAAEVRRHDDRVALHVEASDLDGPDGTREVWLINTDGSRMVSLGLLPAGEAGEFDFPERLLAQGYRIVDISYEPDDGDPTHSGQSLARGTIEG